MKHPLSLLFLICLAVSYASGQSIVGKWKTIDDESGQERSVVEIFERQGKFFGRVIKIFSKAGEDPDPVCKECPDDDPRFQRKVIGMEIIRNMIAVEDYFSEGDILDPKNGKIYRCKLWIEGSKLKVRGYWGPFFRTQTWIRTN